MSDEKSVPAGETNSMTELSGREADEIMLSMQDLINEGETWQPGDLPEDIAPERQLISEEAPAIEIPFVENPTLGNYVTHEYEVSGEAWKLIYAAYRNLNPLVEYTATSLEVIGKQKCLIIYIPDPVTGVKGILPEKFAGLREGERIESLMNLPFIRVLPVSIDRENNIVLLRRDKADALRAGLYWKRIKEGDIVEGLVMGVARSENDRAATIYLDVEGIKAKLPIRELSHNYVVDVDYKRGDMITVKVIKKNEIENPNNLNERMSRTLTVSIKAMAPDPWEIEHCIPVVKQPYVGNIVNIVQTGMFVLLPSGIEVKTPHYSLNYKRKVKVGDRIQIFPVYVDRSARRVQGVLRYEDVDRAIRWIETISENRRKRKPGTEKSTDQ